MEAVILNAGPGAWAFEAHAERLSRSLGVPVCARPAAFNYLLGWEVAEPPLGAGLFIPWSAIQIAADKRLTAAAFARAGVPTPQTHLLELPDEVRDVLSAPAPHE